MSIFKEHKSHADRSASDRRRHREKIDKAIKEGITDIIAEESIIGQNGKKKIKIPVKGIKQYRFVYGSNGSKKVGSSAGNDVSKGQKIKKKGQQQQGPGSGKPGEGKGEEYYEVEISLEELADYLFDSLELPELEQKQFKKMMTEKRKRHGYRSHGIRPRLDKKETVKKKLRRKNLAKRNDENVEEEGFGFRESDLRYKHIKQKTTQNSNAVMFFIMDISGSMTKDKKYISRSFFFLLYHFIRSKYEQTDIVFIAHDAQAYEVSEEQFFSRGSSGGTIVSSALEMCDEIIDKRYHPSSWNVYMFQCSDGDNWATDNNKTSQLLETIIQKCQFVGYCEVEPNDDLMRWSDSRSGLFNLYEKFQSKSFKRTRITSKADIWPAFKDFFGG